MLLTPGTILGEGYQIIRLIGQGGMGAVYMAYDTRLDLKVAIKVIASGVVGNMETSEYELALKRFQAEARIVARIDHPNVIRIYGFKHDTIEHNDKTRKIDYFVMELMAERTLRDTMDESGFEFEEEVRTWVTKYLIPILGGLEEVHKGGIIHRDLKPENIFMKENVAKLADFGLSMGLDFPSVTGSMVDVLGTLAYMAPEQYNNFSLARESADIFAIGRILFEIVEGKITEKTTPFTQVQLANASSEYYQALSNIIMAATVENPIERIGSVAELKELLIDIHKSPLNLPPVVKVEKKPRRKARMISILLITVVLGLIVIAIELYVNLKPNVMSEPQQQRELYNNIDYKPVYGDVDKKLKQSIKSEDNSVLLLIPPMELKLERDNPFREEQISLKAFYLSESPVTNEQYVDFLNNNLDNIKYVDNDVHLNGQLILKLSEKIRGYKPIVFDGVRFHVKQPMHSSCAVLMVTGYGAETYARHLGYRMLRAKEWFALLLSNNSRENPRLQLPTPVINYPQENFGIRGINQVAEWGKSDDDHFLILGLAVSSMVGNGVILEKNPTKYYTDTSFRVAKDAVP